MRDVRGVGSVSYPLEPTITHGQWMGQSQAALNTPGKDIDPGCLPRACFERGPCHNIKVHCLLK